MPLSPHLYQLSQTAIRLEYSPPTAEMLLDITRGQAAVVLEGLPGLKLDQTYFRAKHSGTSPLTITREGVAQRLRQGLTLLQPSFGFLVFDAFRTLETQKSLFKQVALEVKKLHADWPDDKVNEETRNYVFVSDERNQFATPPHNSGGAIDLAITENGKMLDFGTDFDHPTELSSTDYFEQDYRSDLPYSPERWETIRANRRMLFHFMRSLGFTNYPAEWWHYDLGNEKWAEKTASKMIFGAMEEAAGSLLKV